MSYTTLYKVPESGEIEVYAEFKNAYRGAFNVWTEMAKHYLHFDRVPMFNDDKMRQVWGLSKSERVLLNDRIVMASTFDRVMVKKENLLILADAMDDFGQRYNPGHLPEQAQKLRELAQDKTCFAACWNQTSVNADAWEVKTDELDEWGGNIWRSYDVSLDIGHWFLFAEVPLPSLV